MNPRRAELLVLRYSGMAYKDIAKALDLSPTSVGPLLLRAEQRIRESLPRPDRGGKMNKHLNDGQLRAALDQELDEAGMLHLETCPACQQRQVRIKAETQRAVPRLSFLNSPSGQSGPDAKSALIRFHQLNDSRKEISMFKKLFASSTLRVGLAIAVILAVVFSFPQARAGCRPVPEPVPRPAGGGRTGRFYRHPVADRE